MQEVLRMGECMCLEWTMWMVNQCMSDEIKCVEAKLGCFEVASRVARRKRSKKAERTSEIQQR